MVFGVVIEFLLVAGKLFDKKNITPELKVCSSKDFQIFC